MSSNTDQKIKVVPDTLGGLVSCVKRGEYRIPQFQRDYVWEKSRVVDLFDSIYKEYPIGSFFLWKAGQEYNRLFRHAIDLNIPAIEKDDNVSFILDGQQRITSLYVTLMGLSVRGTDYSRICFDVKEEKFTHRAPDSKRYISVSELWQGRLLSIAKNVDEAYQDALDACSQILKTYPVSIVQVREKSLPEVCDIFQRINQAGKRLYRFDLISAMTFSPDFDLRERFQEDIIEPLETKAFGKISSNIVTQLMALIKQGRCTESIQFSLTADDIHGMWPEVVSSIKLAADTLRKCMGVMNAAFLPYDSQLTLLAYLYTKSGKHSLSEEELDWVRRWFWRSSFGQHYGAGGATRVGQDIAMFDQLIAGKSPVFEPSMKLTPNLLTGTKMTSQSAVRNAFLCMLALRKPLDLLNNAPLDLVNGGISDFTSPEKHHIFPQAHLRDSEQEKEVHVLPNFCFLTADLNKRISASRPSKYFSELMEQNQDFDKAARAQLLPPPSESGILEDDYVRFLNIRAKLLVSEIERLTGLSTTPPEEERHAAIESLEERIRDTIHTTLVEGVGLDYWEQCVPEKIRTDVGYRIQSELKKNPSVQEADFESPRVMLDFCNLSDYVDIVVKKANWPHFASTFHRKDDYERHMRAFGDFRNSIMHNRSMNELAQKTGELAITWLEAVLAKDENEDTAQDSDDGNGGEGDTALNEGEPPTQPLKSDEPPESEKPTKQGTRTVAPDRTDMCSEYWTGVMEKLEPAGILDASAKVYRKDNTIFAVGWSKDFWLKSYLSTARNKVGVWFACRGDDFKEDYETLISKKDQIEGSYGAALDWHNHDDQAICGETFSDCDPTNREDWPRQHAMLAEKLEALYRAAAPHIAEIEASK